MKNNELIITPINSESLVGNMQMDSGYNILVDGKRVKRCLNDSGDIVEVSEKAEVKKALIDFNSDNAYTWRLNLDRPGIKKDDIVKWIESHPEVRDATGFRKNKNSSGPPQYEYTLTSEVTINLMKEDDEKADVFTKFNLLNEEQQKSVAVHFGIMPWGLEPGELRNNLVGFTSGAISTNPDFRKDFLTKIDKIMDNVSLNLKSAILCGIVKDSGAVLILEGEVLGTSFEEAVAVLRQRTDLLSLLHRALIKEGKYISASTSSKENKPGTEKKTDKNPGSQNALEPPLGKGKASDKAPVA